MRKSAPYMLAARLSPRETIIETHRLSDRTEAGEPLGAALRERRIDPDIVLAIPQGGLPLGRAVADALDSVVATKIGAPGNPEDAIGAVASDGSVWRNEESFRGTTADEAYFERKREEEAENARRKAERYRGERLEPDLSGKAVVVAGSSLSPRRKAA